MLQLFSVLDGFAIIVGGVVTHLAALFSLLVVIRVPPEYNDEVKTRGAYEIFVALAVLHVFVCIGKGYELYRIIKGKSYSKSV